MKGFALLLNTLHVLNDGLKVTLVLLLPFIAKDLHFNLTTVGFLGSSINLVAILSALIAAYFSVKLGGLRTLLLAMACYTLGFFIVSSASVFIFIAIAFIVAGIGFGLFHPVAFAAISKTNPEENRGKALGNFSAIGDLGAIGISTVSTLLVVRMGWHLISLVIAGILLILLILFLFSRQYYQHIGEKPKTKTTSGALRRNRKFLLTMATVFLDAFASTSIYLYIPFLLLFRGANPAIIGLGSGLYFAGSLIGKLFIGKWVDRFGYVKIFVAAEIFMAVLLVGMALSPWIIVIFVLVIFLGAVARGTSPATKTMIYASVNDPLKAEKGFGISEVFIGIAITISPSLFGFLSDHFTISFAFAIFAMFTALATIPAFIFALEVRKENDIAQIEETVLE